MRTCNWKPHTLVKNVFFLRRERLKGGTPKRTKAAWPEKATSENATCDENMFLFFRENMNHIVPENVEMVCERATEIAENWKNCRELPNCRKLGRNCNICYCSSKCWRICRKFQLREITEKWRESVYVVQHILKNQESLRDFAKVGWKTWVG